MLAARSSPCSSCVCRPPLPGTSPVAAAAVAALSERREEQSGMGGSGKWVKSLIGLKKQPEKEDCKVRRGNEIGVLRFSPEIVPPFLPAVFLVFVFSLNGSCLSSENS